MIRKSESNLIKLLKDQRMDTALQRGRSVAASGPQTHSAPFQRHSAAPFATAALFIEIHLSGFRVFFLTRTEARLQADAGSRSRLNATRSGVRPQSPQTRPDHIRVYWLTFAQLWRGFASHSSRRRSWCRTGASPRRALGQDGAPLSCFDLKCW